LRHLADPLNAKPVHGIVFTATLAVSLNQAKRSSDLDRITVEAPNAESV